MWPSVFASTRSVSRKDWALARQIIRSADALQQTSDNELLTRALDVRYEASSGQHHRLVTAALFPLVLEAARRHLQIRHYPVQVAAGIVLCRGAIAEMQTGEGKTLVATLPLSFHAMIGQPTHLATANDYLAQRDADWLRPVYEALGLTVGSITVDSSTDDRRAAYACDITYSTAREFGFDFLRDQIHRASEQANQSMFHQTADELITYSNHSNETSATQAPVKSQVSPVPKPARPASKLVQRQPFGFILVDEADSLLIDEARTPLIISSEIDDQAAQEEVIRWCSEHAEQFIIGEHIERDDSSRYEFTQMGFRQLRAIAKPHELQPVAHGAQANQPLVALSEIAEAMQRAVYVRETLKRDEHYVVVDESIKIVDEYTGRIADGRKWRNGIHQAVEVRENVPMTPLTIHAAKITLPQYLSHYQQLAGMTGTAASAAKEFQSVYRQRVVRILTHKKSRRKTWSPKVFRNSDERWLAIADEVAEQNAQQRPVLIGTRTVEQSERLSQILQERGLEHEVLNALNHAAEAEIISQAGQSNRITVATNMAGRGTDIKLSADAEAAGGLHVICSEPHSSARIDRQLAGRCARQGDPGTVRQFMSLEDEVLRESNSPDEIAAVIRKLSTISHRGQYRAIQAAQQKVERRHEQQRCMLLHYSKSQIAQHRQLGQDPWLANS